MSMTEGIKETERGSQFIEYYIYSEYSKTDIQISKEIRPLPIYFV